MLTQEQVFEALRPVQDPENSPTTAIYLAELLAAYAADPLEGESFALLLQAGLDDPTGGPVATVQVTPSEDQ